MKKCIRESTMRGSLFFMSIIMYCIISLIYKFSYVDLVYLFVVIGYFAVYLKNMSEV